MPKASDVSHEAHTEEDFIGHLAAMLSCSGLRPEWGCDGPVGKQLVCDMATPEASALRPFYFCDFALHRNGMHRDESIDTGKHRKIFLLGMPPFSYQQNHNNTMWL